MNYARHFNNPFRTGPHDYLLWSGNLEELHREPFSESMRLDEGLLVMISKLIEMTRLLSRCLSHGQRSLMDTFDVLAEEVDRQEEVLTRSLLDAKGYLAKVDEVIQFPLHLERIGDLLEIILNCCRVKLRLNLEFTAKAHAELEQVFVLILDMMSDLRDAFAAPDRLLLEHIILQDGRLSGMLKGFHSAHWSRLLQGSCVPEASSTYLEILDSAKLVSGYLMQMAGSFLRLLGSDALSMETDD